MEPKLEKLRYLLMGGIQVFQCSSEVEAAVVMTESDLWDRLADSASPTVVCVLVGVISY